MVSRSELSLLRIANNLLKEQFHSFVDYDEEFVAQLPGIIVPQKVFKSRTQYAPYPRIKFSVCGRPGIRLEDAAAMLSSSDLW